MRIGAQLYTVREFMKTPYDMAQTLEKIAALGYRFVQLSGSGPYDPRWMREQLEANGLRCVLTHIPVERLVNEPQRVADEHEILGCERVGIGYYDIAGEGLDAFVEKFQPVAQAFAQRGLYLMYHNHNQEFERLQGELILQGMLRRFAPDQLGITLDTYWVQAGGGDPAWWIRSLAGRTPCIHLKDMGYGRLAQGDGKGAIMLPVGEGNMNMDAIVQAARDSGVQYALVEQDACNGEDPFACLGRSYRALKAYGLE